MTDQTTPAAPANTPSWPMLSLIERRILGVLIEKQKTTPDVYPMTINSLVTGCNQKSNRDPVLSLDDAEIEETLGGMQKKSLVMRVDSGRVEKWRHLLYEQWHLSRLEIAILAELLLRGPQTEGDLRSRASRMDAIEDLDTLRNLLQPLVRRGLVVYLTPEGRRGTILTHGFHDAQELIHLKDRHAGQSEPAEIARPARSAANPDALASLAARVQQLQEAQERQTQLWQELREEIARLRTELAAQMPTRGVPPAPPGS